MKTAEDRLKEVLYLIRKEVLEEEVEKLRIKAAAANERAARVAAKDGGNRSYLAEWWDGRASGLDEVLAHFEQLLDSSKYALPENVYLEG